MLGAELYIAWMASEVATSENSQKLVFERFKGLTRRTKSPVLGLQADDTPVNSIDGYRV